MQGVDEALAHLLAEKTYLKAPQGAPPLPPNINGGSGGIPGPAPVAMNDAQRAMAQKMGIDPGKYAEYIRLKS